MVKKGEPATSGGFSAAIVISADAETPAETFDAATVTFIVTSDVEMGVQVTLRLLFESIDTLECGLAVT